MTVSELQAELVRVNAAYVAAACEHRESKAALLQRVRALEADLATAKEACKDFEYHKQQVAASSETETLRKRVRELEAVAVEHDGLKKRVCELEAAVVADEETAKRLRELEAVERGWKHLRGVFAA
jgi:hypothetical protein